MSKEKVEVMVEGGKASAGPAMGQAFGPLGVNIQDILAKINEKTADFNGMKVPVTVTVDTEDKSFELEIGTPPISELMKKEINLKKGSGLQKIKKSANISMEQVIKIAKMKEDSLLGSDLKAKVKEIVGTCQSMGVMVEGKSAQEALKAIDAGEFDTKISSGRTELTEEEKKQMEEEKIRLQEELEKRRAEFEEKAKSIHKMYEKDNRKARKFMVEAGIPQNIIDEIAPEEKKDAAVKK